MSPILKVEQLKISFDAYKGKVQAVRDVSFCVERGELLALVGESGCGKSVTAQAILGLLPCPPARISAKNLVLGDVNILQATEKELRQIRGRVASMVFQDPLTCLNPTMRVGQQVTEILLRRGMMSPSQCKQEAVRLLELVQITDAQWRARQYPHQFSGGMRQRAMLALALAGKPDLLIADEPTTALDVTVQLQILILIKQLQRQFNMGVLLITHDFSVVANTADRVAVMYAGEIVECADVKQMFQSPLHPYTRGLMDSLPKPHNQAELISIPGRPPDLFFPPEGCAFAPRCKHAMGICVRQKPEIFTRGECHQVSCWKYHPECERGHGL